MKVLILCGGRGIQLKEGGELIQKALIPIGGSTMIHTIMKHFSFYGITDFILCVDSKGHEIKASLEDQNLSEQEKKNMSGWNIRFLETGDSVMTGARILKAKDLLGDEDFFVSYIDTLADINISKLLQTHKAKGCVLTMTGVHPMTYLGVISHEEGYVTGFDVTAKISSTIKGGYFICKPKIFDYLSDDPGCALEDTPLKRLIEEKEVALFDHDGFWKHLDFFKDLEHLKKLTTEDNPSWIIR
ncbi:sugar phosphate nucleotidyltransferase [Nanoarchaeota archaeon]